ncbi:ribose-5-phosphate isomerase, partial [Levilactobacillus bambusae]
IETIQEFFLKRKIDKASVDEANIKTLYSEKLIGISIPIK